MSCVGVRESMDKSEALILVLISKSCLFFIYMHVFVCMYMCMCVCDHMSAWYPKRPEEDIRFSQELALWTVMSCHVGSELGSSIRA